MKIYTKLIIDIESDTIITSTEAPYVGLVAQTKGGGKSTTTVTIPPPTAEETEQRLMSNRANQLSMRQQGYKWNGSDFVPLGEEEFTPEEQQQRKIEKLYGAEALRRAEAGFGATPEEKAVLDQMYEGAKGSGQENIRQFMAELSGSRGMDIAESSPMAREAARAQGELIQGLETGRATANLDFAERSRAFGQEMTNFQTGLRQRAMENKMASGGFAANQANNLGQLRAAQTTTTSKTKGGGGGFLGALGGIGGMLMPGGK